MRYIIIGSSQGIGKEIAGSLIKKHELILCSRNITKVKMKFEQINAIVKSLKYPFKGAACRLKNKLLQIHGLKKYNKKITGKFSPGEIMKIHNFDIAVKVINGGVLLREIEYDGRHMLPAHLADSLNLKKRDKFS